MANVARPLLLKLLVFTLRPAVHFCVKHSIKIQDLIECAKVAFIEVARKELSQRGHKLNISRMSVVTGVHRRDIMRFEESGLDDGIERDLIARVMGHWRTDKRFTTKSGDPRVLTISGDQPEFGELCRSISKDINPGTVLFELERVDAVEHTKGGIKLIHQSYVPKGDPAAGFAIFADDSKTLLDTVEENVLTPREIPQLHARTSYDNVRPEAAAEIQRWLLKEGHDFHARARTFISKFDQDINPEAGFTGPGITVVTGTFGNVGSSTKKAKAEKDNP